MTNSNVDVIRPHSVAWYRNMQKQGKTLAAGVTSSGFPDATAATGLEDYDQTKSYVKNGLTYRAGALFRANSAIPPNTPFSEGPADLQWTNVSESLVLLDDHDPAVVYQANEPVFKNEIIYRAISDNTTGPWVKSQWQMISQPPARVFLEAGDSDSRVLEGFRLQEIIFDTDRVISGFTFSEGDRIILRKDLSGTITSADFLYYGVSDAGVPDEPVTTVDVNYIGTIGTVNDGFYIIAAGTDIDIAVDLAGKVTWDTTATLAAGGEVIKVTYTSTMDNITREIDPADYVVASDGKSLRFTTLDLDQDDVIEILHRPA